jgi:hypothetical protein
VLHAPIGLLKEKILGSSSSIVKPETGQAKFSEKIISSFVSVNSAIATAMIVHLLSKPISVPMIYA